MAHRLTEIIENGAGCCADGIRDREQQTNTKATVRLYSVDIGNREDGYTTAIIEPEETNERVLDSFFIHIDSYLLAVQDSDETTRQILRKMVTKFISFTVALWHGWPCNSPYFRYCLIQFLLGLQRLEEKNR